MGYEFTREDACAVGQFMADVQWGLKLIGAGCFSIAVALVFIGYAILQGATQ